MSVVVLDRHVAEARRRIAKRYQIDVHANDDLARALRPSPPKWYEAEPHCGDPLWRMFVVRSIEQRAWACQVDASELTIFASHSPRVAHVIICDAARMLREYAGGLCGSM